MATTLEISKLHEAAMKGSVEDLLELLQRAPLLLDEVVADPPLHVAALHGHANFANEILQRKPQLARVLDSKGSCPLHLAAAEGHVEIVKFLRQVDSHVCLFRNSDGWNPLQLAAVNGRVDALKELVRAQPEAARARIPVDRGGNALHLCVKNNQLEALKVLVGHGVDDHGVDDHAFLNAKDNFGCSILHLALTSKQIETIRFLMDTHGMELDGLFQTNRDENDLATAELPGAVAAPPPLPGGRSDSENRRSCRERWWCNEGRQGEGQPVIMRQREALMVVASVVATMAFQAAINPPGGMWKDAGKSTIHPIRFGCFISSITFSFVFSIIELFLLITDYPSSIPLFLTFLWFAKIFSIGAITLAFGIAIFCLT